MSLFSGPRQIRAADELRKGKALVYGTVHTETPLESPINRRPCAAVYYRSSYMRGSRLRGFQRAFLRDALTYAEGLELEVDGVRVQLRPAENQPFTHTDHQAMKAEGYDRFGAKEQRVPVGHEVCAQGKLTLEGEQWVMRVEQLHFEPATEPEKTASSKKKKKARRPSPRRRR